MHGRKYAKQTLGGGKCKCEVSFKKVDFVAHSGCVEDDAAVAALPDTWVPKQSGPILANYLKEREQKHEHLLKDLKEAAAEVNEKLDVKIRNLAEDFLAHIQQNQRNMDSIVCKCAETGTPLNKDTRSKALDEINLLSNQRINDMARFKLDALVLERERADGLRVILRDFFQKLIAVGHQTPKDLLHDFDQRIYDINQQLLSNCRAYTELEARLRVQVDESIIRVRSSLNQMSLGVTMLHRGRSAQPWFKEQRSSNQRVVSAVDKKRRSSDPTINRILNETEELEECVSSLVQAYRSAVMKVFTGFSGKLSVLQRCLGSHHAIHDQESCDISDLQQLIERTLHRLSSIIHLKKLPSMDLIAITSADISSMQKSLCSLGECLRITYTILYDAGHLWDSHMLRLALAQKLTIAAVEDLLTSNDTLELANEMNFNVALEQLRCATDADKLQQQFEVIMAMLERTSDMYLQHSEAEVGRLQEFMNLPPFMSKTLLAEFDCFLEKHPRPLLQSIGSMNSQPVPGSPWSNQANALRSPLPRAIMQTELQEVALQNWRNGFLESFQSNINFVPEELQHQAQLWVEERAGALHMRFSLKLVSNSIRAERVKAARDFRLAELRFHETRLESHLAAVYNLIDNLPIEASEFLSLDSEYLYPLCKWVSRIQNVMDAMTAQDAVDTEVRRLKMLSYGPRLAKHRILFEESLDTAIENYKRQLEHRIQEGRISNLRFMSQVRLFNEGGRYAASEATKTSAALVKSADALELCVNRSMDALNHRRSQLLAMADQQLLPIQRVIEDVYKVTGKGADKKKPPPPKRK